MIFVFLQTSFAWHVLVFQKQNKNEFCVVELHVGTSDVWNSACGYRCGISLHVTDLPPGKVIFATILDS